MTVDLPSFLSRSSRILDAGGWFAPFPAATHVVDLMPYETRGARLCPAPLPGECFSRQTWFQADFTAPSFRLPWPDGFFDFSVCGHTIEDLPDPTALLAELRRVSRAGYIETPSRLSEQTIGCRDRMSQLPGHPHHHWIVEADGDRLILSRKAAALTGSVRGCTVPLRTFESRNQAYPGVELLRFHWSGHFEWEILADPEAARRARTLVSGLDVSPATRLADALVRRLRRMRQVLSRRTPRTTEAWWRDMLALSRPYSSLPL